MPKFGMHGQLGSDSVLAYPESDATPDALQAINVLTPMAPPEGAH